jgi:Ca-activated chloride channel homolog
MRLRNSRARFRLIAFLSIAIALECGCAGKRAFRSSVPPATDSQTATAPASSQGAGSQGVPGSVPNSSQQASQPAAQTQPPQSTQSSNTPGSSAGSTSSPAPATPAAPSQASPSQDPQPQDQQSQGQAQGNNQAGGNEGSVFVFHAEVQNVIVHATVVDEKNRLVTNLDKSAFTVFENNQPQTIVSFRHEDVPVAMGIVIDNSGSMREKRDKVNKAAINLVRSSNPQDQVFVVNFNDEYYLDQPFTGNIDKLREALEKVDARGGTALYDAMVASADYMKKQSQLQKKVLFVVTDGEDNASRETLEEAVKKLQEENGPTVYAIGLLGEERAHRARRALETVAQRTGGIAFFPKTLDEVDEISRTVAHDIRNQYTLSYKPTTPKSVGGYRAIHVEAHAKGYGKLTVRTRSGYYPGQETKM